ncbi:DNA polymerase III subunit alpha [Sinomonas atrocyanea]|uniref:Error-prone DNA polymerase n=1 Tax=Sinomonas atrocyanea TaxID=37927 RepID=A0A127A4F1_9MICC|nr:error-prone DNA polymerase [Sinomonas atrocyanea]AMM33771.1 DNA polymerase III subunit alpha [Sinomonas atrocyanea]GEB64345.1 error-prone DNA polymerase [Sinomonas atrocyanea]GGG70965.1 error-prone DNA polymerase [Sinomonas atrocyanea]
MGWTNPPIPWRQLHDILDGKEVTADELRGRTGAGRAPVEHDGGDSPAWSRKRGPYIPLPALSGGPRAGGGDGTDAQAAGAHDGGRSPSSVGSPAAVPYAELHVHSHYSFLDGASSPEELVEEAVRLGLSAIAITDHDGFYGAVRLAEAAEAYGLATVFGAELSLGLSAPQNGRPDPEGEHLLVLARGEEGYHRLAGAITAGQLAREAEKGRPVFVLEDLAERLRGHCVVLSGCRKGVVRRALVDHGEAAAERAVRTLVELFGHDGVAVELYDQGSPLDTDHNDVLAALAARLDLPCVATNAVHFAAPSRHPLATALAAVRARRSLDELDGWLPATDGAHLRSGAEMAHRFARYPGAVENTVRLAGALAFPLRSARPRLPKQEVPEGSTPMSHLRDLVELGLADRYGVPGPGWRGPVPPEEVRERLEKELAVIEKKDFPGYFLIVHEIVQFARSRGILCQGRGSAANSAVCYLLGITAVDSIAYRLPFERFLSSLREEEPDIDVDFDSDRREEVIQHVYAKYGRANAAQVANVISYRPKNAVRDAAKALGYGPGQQDAWSKRLERWDALSAAGSDDADGIPPRVVALAEQFLGYPRHLGIHSGGMVLTERPVGEVVPIEHARMENRTVLQWDKDDCEWMGLVKFDLLGLGMLAALQYCFDLVEEHFGVRWRIEDLPKEEPAVYDMLCRADSVGVFQVESRAQMSTLPRLRPRCFYDLVVEIALIRPGPIQGGAVHPYIRRRAGEEPVTYPHPLLEPVLERTLGVPLFQEQLMQMAMAIGGCTAEDADLLRRAMGSKRGVEKIGSLKEKLFAGMAANGLTPEESKAIYTQIAAFADFGFAESHSISFAVLVYASSWLKLHYPGAFLAALLRAQPMGFYSPQTLVADARRHGVTVLRPDILRSRADACLEPHDGTHDGADDAGREAPAAGSPHAPGPGASTQAPASPGLETCLDRVQPPIGPFDPQAPDEGAAHRRDGSRAVRLGLSSVRGIGQDLAERIVAEREAGGPFRELAELSRRTGLTAEQLEALSSAGALDSLGLTRREALWQSGAAALERPGQLPGSQPYVQPPLLPELAAEDAVAYDLWATGVATDDHPLRHARGRLDARGVLQISQLETAAPGGRIEVAGIVTHRQRPQTAQGITFMNIEDETGILNVVCSIGVWTRYRRTAQAAPAMVIRGMLERSKEGVTNLVADRLEALPLKAKTASRDFR